MAEKKTAAAAAAAQEALTTGTQTMTAVVDESTRRAQDTAAQALTIAKQVGLVSLDAYEKSFQALTEFQKKFIVPTGIETVDHAIAAQAKLISDWNDAATGAVRQVLA